MPAHLNSQARECKVCLIVGYSIDALTTATVLASLGQTVHLYADEQALQETLATYKFEYQLQALWQLYRSQQQVIIYPVPTDVNELLAPISVSKAAEDRGHKTDQQTQVDLYWLFYPELPESWRKQSGIQNVWLSKFNESTATAQVPLVLSGIEQLGTFASLAKQFQHDLIYYVPFVFLQDGHVYSSMLSPTLWLMGEKTVNSSHKLTVLQPLMAQAQQTYITDIATTEFARSAIMNMLATRVSFMNEWSRLADHQGVDISEVANIMGLDERIGKSYLKAGWGFGGQTLPAEISALQKTLGNVHKENRLMHAVNQINDDQKELIFRKFWQYFDGKIEGRTVNIWGASYKEGSGRTSASAIHPLLNLLWSYDITTCVYAGEAETELARLYSDQPLLNFVHQPATELEQAHALFILVWPVYQPVPIEAINKVALPIFDAQNALSKVQIAALIGDYVGIGRSK